MKKLFIAFLFMSVVFISNGYSTIIRVEVGPGSSRSFVPQNINAAIVGDTIRWVWKSGVHTTTSTTIPLGATTWDAPITATDTVFNYIIPVAGTYNYECTFHASMGMIGTIIAGVSGINSTGETANSFNLSQNFPNPFNPSTVIKFSIPKNGFVSLKIYDVTGKEIRSLINNQLSQGTYNYNFNAENLSSGIYYYKLSAGDYSDIKKMLLMK